MPTIDDGEGFDAVAQRLPDVVRLSRKSLEGFARSGTLTATFLTAMILHEVGHDCSLNGSPVTDKQDALLNELAEGLIRASNNSVNTQVIDVHFVERVNAGNSVVFHELSAATRRKIVQKYLDYVGDWVYSRERRLFGDRPAPASDFFADYKTSVYEGWGRLPQTVLSQSSFGPVLEGILKPSFERTGFFYSLSNGTVEQLPSALQCLSVRDEDSALNASTCSLTVHWSHLLPDPHGLLKQEIRFTLDVLGTLQIHSVRVY